MSKVFIALKITIYIKKSRPNWHVSSVYREVRTYYVKKLRRQPKETPAQTPVQTPALASSIEGISVPDSENRSTEGKNESLSISKEINLKCAKSFFLFYFEKKPQKMTIVTPPPPRGVELGLPGLKSRDIPLDYQAFRYKILARTGYLSCRRPGM